ncbi:MAG TPA: DUF1993 domain-containing protein [Polyangiaceae bacterium]|nr:DUF1993 domain-containing protein [Polyangiaceae bacterium]
MFFQVVSQFKRQLQQIESWFDAAQNFAKERAFDPNVFASQRLAPDQFALARQVQIACDTAKFAVARLSGKDAPNHPDTEQTLDELRGRIRSVVGYLDGFSAKDFEGAATRTISQPRWEGKTMTGADYFVEHVVPNFHFHFTHVYAILRHNGVPLGKKDYLGAITMKSPG